MREIRRSALVPVPAQRMFALINEVERYPEFVPGCQAASVLERAEGMQRARLTVGSGALRTSFVTRNHLVPYSSVRMDLEEGPFRSLVGEWTLEPVPAVGGCSVQLVLRFELQRGLAGLAMGPLIERMAGSLVDAFVARARQGVAAAAGAAAGAGSAAAAGAADTESAAGAATSDRST